MKRKDVAALIVPTSELPLIIGVKKVIAKKIEKETGCNITVEDNKTKDGSAQTSIVRVVGKAKSIINAQVKLFKLLSKSENLHELVCSDESTDVLLRWSDDRLVEFQSEHKVLLDFNDSGKVTMKAWDEECLKFAEKELENWKSESESGSDSEENPSEELSYIATVKVSGCPKFDVGKLKTVQDKTESKISPCVVHAKKKKNSYTTFTVLSKNKDDRQNAVNRVTKMLKEVQLESVDLARAKPLKRIGNGTSSKRDKNEESSSDSDATTVPLQSTSSKRSAGGKRKKRTVRESSTEEESGDSSDDSAAERNHTEKARPKYPKHMNILMLGETGVGKSTFINGLVNYLKYDSMDEALDEGVQVLIKSSFTLTDDDFNTKEIVSEPTVEDEQGFASNESMKKGQSATQDPKSYVFHWMDEGEEKSIRIIDTPGIGDTRGLEQDKINFNKILSFIADFSELHAVCILVKPNASRLTLAFRFCIDELLVHLHKSASKNILFCFTNTRGTLYKPGDTLPTLKEHLDKLRDTRGIEIPLNMSTLFSFDNESFRFLCACEKGFPFSNVDKDNFNGSWTKSVQESLRLFARITELPVHSVEDTLCLNNTRAVILTLARPLAEIARNQMINKQLIEDKLVEIENHMKEGNDLRGKLSVDQIVIRAEEIDYPQTVCTAAGCVEHRRFNADPNAPMQTVYKTICHDHCHLDGVQVENCPNQELQKCWAMSSSGGATCRMCSCQWSTHMHLRYKLTQTMEKVTDPTVAASIANKDDQVKTAELFLKAAREKVEELKKESERITKICAEFAAFLAKHSILPYNDSYRQYIDHLIKEEREKVAAGGPDAVLREMERYKDEYEQQVKLLNDCMDMNSPSARVRGVKDMNDMVEELKNLKHCGSVLAEVQKLELLKVRHRQKHAGKVVPVNGSSGFFTAPIRMFERFRNSFSFFGKK